MSLDLSTKYNNSVEVIVGTLSEHINQLTHDLKVSAEGKYRREQNFLTEIIQNPTSNKEQIIMYVYISYEVYKNYKRRLLRPNSM